MDAENNRNIRHSENFSKKMQLTGHILHAQYNTLAKNCS